MKKLNLKSAWIGAAILLSFANPLTAADKTEFTKAESFKKAYVDSGLFDHVGVALPERDFKDNYKMTGASYHFNSFTAENEMKPQWIMWWYSGVPAHKTTFTDSYGTTITVPDHMLSDKDPSHGLGGIRSILEKAQASGMQVRGHTLTWHSQTFDWFFCEDYDVNKGLTDAKTMTARHEWYIKTVLEYVNNWEKTYNGGKHIIYAWDVVNEAAADDASGPSYLRGATNGTSKPWDLKNGCNTNGGSLWYRIYKSDEFIVNAFRFANKYAPKDVTLCYNDYNEYMGQKTNAIVRILESIQRHQSDSFLPTRIDAMGLQSHVGYSWPGVAGYESALKRYLAMGLDCQVTELEIAAKASVQSEANGVADKYREYFDMFIRNRKQGNKPGITSITVWGLVDETSWIQKPNEKFVPLLFTQEGGKIYKKQSFDEVIKAAKTK